MARTILLVEDNEDCRFLFVLILHSMGYKTIEAESGLQAVQRALFEKPDLILMDLGLLDMSGIDAAIAIKKNLMTAHIPIIAHTARSADRWKENALKAGMVGYLEKPVSKELIKATIEKFLTGEKCCRKVAHGISNQHGL